MQTRRASPPLAVASAFTRLLRLHRQAETIPPYQQHYRSVNRDLVSPIMCCASGFGSCHVHLRRHYATRSTPLAAAGSSAVRKKAAAAATVKMAEAWEQREGTARSPHAQHQPISPAAAVVASVPERPDEAEGADEEGEEEEDDDADDPEWEKLRAALDSEGVYVAPDGAELLSMAEVERRLSSGELDGEQSTDDEDDDDDVEDEDEQEDDDVAERKDEEDEEDDEDWDDDEEEAVEPARPPSRPAARGGRSSPPAQVMWIQERPDGSVSLRPWPLADDDGEDAEAALSSSYALNMPTPRLSDPSAVIGSSVGGEAVSLHSVAVLDERELSEHFTKGGGRGGQKVNKTSNCVHLLHRPTGTVVKCHATRSLSDNRRIARDIMQRRLEELVLGPASRNQQKRSKIRKSKAKSRRRRAIKYDESNEDEGQESAHTSDRLAAAPASGRPPLAVPVVSLRASVNSPAEQSMVATAALGSDKAP